MFIKNLWPCVASDALFQTTDKLHQPTDYLSAESEHNDILPSSLSSFQKDLYIYIYRLYTVCRFCRSLHDPRITHPSQAHLIRVPRLPRCRLEEFPGERHREIDRNAGASQRFPHLPQGRLASQGKMAVLSGNQGTSNRSRPAQS